MAFRCGNLEETWHAASVHGNKKGITHQNALKIASAALKYGRAVLKNASATLKNGREALKNALESLRNASAVLKNASEALKTAIAALKNAREADSQPFFCAAIDHYTL
ncbi:hypothetical protein [Parabacteroides sp. FAFU027]|uniref:hypothetical protein n=1 Tax=Parabacteroides sp. FAFU027 TaxID=2922715 RepID=UPI001FAF0FA9|nr:hypothetical protein [Parabacteroides sp. FAFU027]